jgi:hypothetical protein
MLEYLITCKPDSDPYLTSETKHWPGKNRAAYLGRVFSMKSLLHNNVAAPFLSKLLFSLGVSLFFVLPLSADEITNITDFKGCRAIKGETERLACYDTISEGGIFNEQKLKQVQVEEFGSSKMPKAVEPAPAPAASTAATTAPSASTSTATTKSQKKDGSSKKLAVTIVRSKKDVNGYHYFQTSDGQVWKQLNANSWSLSVPFDAVIKAGVLGSFFLVNEGGKSTRVKRVR